MQETRVTALMCCICMMERTLQAPNQEEGWEVQVLVEVALVA